MASPTRLLTAVLLLATLATTTLPAQEPPPSRRALSSEISDALTASLPKYNPPAKPAEGTDADATAADTDPWADLPKPKNGIVRLPRVVVEGNRPPIFSEREIHTRQGLADLAVKRYFKSDTLLALNRFTLPLVGMGKEAFAMLLYDQDERLRLLSEYGADADLLDALGETTRATELRDLLNDTLSHEPLFLSSARTPFRDARGQ
ncbi:hypothetical protein [Actomonas aquatica]|uniref:Uncharacterized protein n=1 Tax=Actomonas aquatica TaxID=2866162 RepID=A0ABZ1C938_9BACT|nr:hypothetical protein [Opitutus sp. WL0086]WRQ87099.1 hypothetical protein K1X11_019970 [Opitutus sp. WL0086]